MQKEPNVVLPAGKPCRFLLGEKIKKTGKTFVAFTGLGSLKEPFNTHKKSLLMNPLLDPIVGPDSQGFNLAFLGVCGSQHNHRD